MEKFAPSQVGKGGFAQAMRLGGAIGVIGGFLYFYERSSCTSGGGRAFYQTGQPTAKVAN